MAIDIGWVFLCTDVDRELHIKLRAAYLSIASRSV